MPAGGTASTLVTHLLDQAHPDERGTNLRAAERSLRERCVEHALFSELLVETASDAIDRAADALAHHEDRRVAAHLFKD